MPFNVYGDLTKRGIVAKLNSLGFPIKSVHSLNLIMERMGLQKHYGNDWLPTKEGVKYTIYNCAVFNAKAWHPEIVDAIIRYLQENPD